MRLPYPIKHWLATLVISPIFLVIYYVVVETRFVLDDLSIYLLFLFMGILISLPAILVYWFAYKKMVNTDLSDLQMRLWLMLVAGIIAVTCFWLIKGSLMIQMMIAYAMGILVSSWLFVVRDEIVTS